MKTASTFCVANTIKNIAITLALALFVISPIANPVAWSQDQSTINDLFAQIGSRVPSFGGMYVDPDKDTLYVYMAGQPGDLGELDLAITEILGANRPPEDKLVALQGEYTFLQLKSWQDYSDPELLSIPGVLSTGIHHTTNRLEIGVATPEARTAVLAEFAALGIPLEAVEVVQETAPEEEQSEVKPEKCYEQKVATCDDVRAKCRPVVGGLQIHADKDPKDVCSTLSFNATRAGISGFVTCSHCANEAFKDTGTKYDQNELNDAHIGIEAWNPGLVGGVLDGMYTCPKDATCRLSDSSFAKYDGVDEKDIKVGYIARPKLNSTEWNGTDYFTIAAYSSSIEGENIAKVGRTTGFTEGTVKGICRNRPRPKKKATDPDEWLLCQNTADFNATSGDSGAPVFLCSNAKCSAAAIFSVRLLGVYNGRYMQEGKELRYYSDIVLIQDPTTELGPLKKFCAASKNPTCS